MLDSWRIQKRQFRILYLVFLTRVVDLELLSADADASKLVSQFMTIFASISFALSVPTLLLFGEGILRSGAWTPEHFFLATTLLVTGLMSLLTWEAAFPDRRDLLVLGPLPVRGGTVFAAKIAALFAAQVLAVVSLNIFTGLFWPLLFMSHHHGLAGMLRTWPAWWMTMVAASTFLFCTMLTLQGLVTQLLPRQVYLRLAGLLQASILCLLVTTYLMEPPLERVTALTDPANHRMLSWLPSYWYLGVWQQINGTMDPAFGWLARRGWVALALSLAGALATVTLSYVRTMRKMIEQPDIVPVVRSVGGIRWLGGTLETAIATFSVRTLLRSRQHRMILSFYGGIGLAVAVGYLSAPSAAMARDVPGIHRATLFVSLLSIGLATFAMRVAATLPIALKANWIFRITQERPAERYRRAVQRSWLALGTGSAGVVVAATTLVLYPWKPALEHLLAAGLFGWMLMEMCLLGFRKIPFTCSYLPGKANVHFSLWATLVLGLWLVDGASKLEERMLRDARNWLEMIAVLAVALLVVRRIGKRSGGELQFEEKYPAVVTTLGLR